MEKIFFYIIFLSKTIVNPLRKQNPYHSNRPYTDGFAFINQIFIPKLAQNFFLGQYFTVGCVFSLTTHGEMMKICQFCKYEINQ